MASELSSEGQTAPQRISASIVCALGFGEFWKEGGLHALIFTEYIVRTHLNLTTMRVVFFSR